MPTASHHDRIKSQTLSKVAGPRLGCSDEDQLPPDSSTTAIKTPLAHSCEPCRISKTKCSGERPSCQHCVAFHSICVYEDDSRHWAKKQVPTEELLPELRSVIDSSMRKLGVKGQKSTSSLKDLEGEIGHKIESRETFSSEICENKMSKKGQTEHNQHPIIRESPTEKQEERVTQGWEEDSGHLENLETPSLTLSRFRVQVSTGEEYSFTNSMKLWVQRVTRESWDWWPLCGTFRPLLQDEIRIQWSCVGTVLDRLILAC